MSKLSLYNPLLSLKGHLKWLYIANKMEYFGYKGRCSVINTEAFKEKSGLGYK